MSFITIKNIKKQYKVKQKQNIFKDIFKPKYNIIKAVDDISCSIKKGELIGFIGPNGAGKTTTIKMLTGILWPTDGEIIANKYIPHKQRKEYLKEVGVVFGQRKSLWPELSVRQNIELIASFYGIKNSEFKKRLTELSKIIFIEEYLNQPFRKLSLGQQMKAELVSALIHKPKILFLDEPTIGMDIIAKLDFIKLLQRLNEVEKTTIILTSHDLHEVENLCKRIIIINKGKILFDGNIDKIKPKEIIIEYEHEGKLYSKQVKKIDLKKELNKLEFNEIRIKELSLEKVIKPFYK